MFCAYWQAVDGTRRDPGTCATPAPARPLIQIREEAEGHANRMRTDCIDGRIFVHLLSHRTATEATDTFRKARHQIKKSCNAAHDFICLHTSANFGPFFSFPFLHTPPPTLPLISFLECASIEDPWWGATEVIFICLITVGLHFPPPMSFGGWDHIVPVLRPSERQKCWNTYLIWVCWTQGGKFLHSCLSFTLQSEVWIKHR